MSQAETKPVALIIAGGDISRKLPYLRASCSCPALIPVNTRPLASYVMDVYRGLADIHLFVDESFIKEVTDELPPRKHGYQLHGIQSGTGVLHTLTQAINLPDLGDDIIVNLVTTIATTIPPAAHVQVARQPERTNGAWATILSKGDSLHFFTKGKNHSADALAFTGVFRLPHDILRQAVTSAGSENDLVSVLQSASAITSLQLQTVDWIDCGHEINYYKSRALLINSRSFNRLQVDTRRGTIRKSSLDQAKLSLEADYFEALPAPLRVLFPRLTARSGAGKLTESYELEYYGYPNLAEYLLYWNLSKESWWRCFDSLNEILDLLRKHPASIGPSLYRKFHWEKSISRIDTYLSSIKDRNLANTLAEKAITLNGKRLASLPQLLASAENLLSTSYREEIFSVFHGDFCFNNILFDVSSGIVRLIDPRGSFGDGFPGIHGDWRYDLAKLAHSATGHYDYFVNGLFDVWSTSTEDFHLNTVLRPQSQHFPEMMEWIIRSQQADPLEINTITGLLFLSMCPLHPDDTSRQLAFFLRGMEILNDSLQ